MLSKGKTLERFFRLRDEVKEFLKPTAEHYYEEFDQIPWQLDSVLLLI